MNDPNESLRRYFVMSEQASTETPNRIEVLVETLREVLPGFKEEHSRQARLQGERRAERPSATLFSAPAQKL
jgi:hypothetical protein